MELASSAKGNGLRQADISTPPVTGQSEFFSGSLGLQNGSSSYNQYRRCGSQSGNGEILRRKKRTKRKRGLGL